MFRNTSQTSRHKITTKTNTMKITHAYPKGTIEARLAIVIRDMFNSNMIVTNNFATDLLFILGLQLQNPQLLTKYNIDVTITEESVNITILLPE